MLEVLLTGVLAFGPAADESTPAEAPPTDEVAPGDYVPPKHALAYENILVARLNPLGLENRLWLGYQYRLYDRRGKLFDTSRIAVFANPIVTPAVMRLGGTLEVTPLAILRLRATYGWVKYYKTFEYLQSFDSPHDDFSDQFHDEGKDAGDNYAARGNQLELNARLQAKVWRIAFRSEVTGVYSDMALTGDDDLFYSPRYDALMPNNGWVLINDTDLLYVHDFETAGSMIVGARNTLTKHFFPEASYEAGDDTDDPIGVMNRLGPFLAYTFYDRPQKRFNKPTVLLISQWHIKQPWRTGKVEYTDDMGDTQTRGSSAAIPTLVLGFAFTGVIFGE